MVFSEYFMTDRVPRQSLSAWIDQTVWVTWVLIQSAVSGSKTPPSFSCGFTTRFGWVIVQNMPCIRVIWLVRAPLGFFSCR